MEPSEAFLKEWETRMEAKKKVMAEEEIAREAHEARVKKQKLEQAADGLRKSYLRRTGRSEMKP